MSGLQPIQQSTPALKVERVGKAFKVYQKPSDMLLEHLTGKQRHVDHWAVSDVSFEMEKGEIVGIIGPNGAGKSTLLRMIAGTLAPSTGTITASGKISAILELGTGFHPEQTGRENVLFGGMCVGMTADEIAAKADSIIDFAELRHVIDQPFKTYSSGMQARLTFATAISIDPDILVIDEALAAGDSYFVAKCFRRIRQICESGSTVLFVSHGTAQVAQLCHRAVWIEKGKVREIGAAREVAKHYDYETHVRIADGLGKIVEIEPQADEPVQEDAGAGMLISGALNPGPADKSQTIAQAEAQADAPVKVFRKGPVVIDRVRFYGADGRPRTTFRTWEELTIEIEYSCSPDYIPVETLGLAIAFERESDLVLIAQFNTVNYAGNETEDYHDAPYRQQASSKGVMRAVLPSMQVMNGSYLVSLGLIPNVPGTQEFYEYHHRTYKLTVITSGYPSGAAFYPIVRWSHQALSESRAVDGETA